MSTLSKSGEIAGNLGLLLEAEKVAQSFMKGVHGRRRTGTGEAFWQFRPWQPGDSRRDIDWRQSAKRGEAFVRQTEWEAAQTVFLYRDASASMDFGGKAEGDTLRKKEYAEVLLLALGIVLLNGGEQVGLLGTDLAPQTGYPSIQRIFEMLPAQKQLADSGRPVKGRSHAVIISDFYFPLEELGEFCEKLAARHVSGTLVQVFHPAEQSLPYGGRVRFEDIEGLDTEALDITQVEAIREEYEQKFIAHQEALADMAKGLHWHFEKLSTDIKPETALSTLYDVLAVKGDAR
jgi:uncharacterized protein (DUF58 family)